MRRKASIDRKWAAGVLAAAGATLLALVAAGTSWSATVPRGTSWDSVIVRATPGHTRVVEKAVRRLHGRVDRRLDIIHGFSATMPHAAAIALRSVPSVVSVTPNGVLHAMSYNASSDAGSMLNTSQMTGAQAYWAAGYTGRGVDVALIDSGVAPVDGLTYPDKVINGPDLSFDSQAPNLTYLDSLGHGTHMAGIIAGRANGAVTGAYVGDQTNFLGMAPDARIVSIKVADAPRKHGRLAGDRSDRLGRPAPARQRPEHPRAQSLLRDEQRPGLHDRSSRLRGRGGLEEGLRVVVTAAGNAGFVRGRLSHQPVDRSVRDRSWRRRHAGHGRLHR